MASRGGTAAPQSQPASILKLPRSQAGVSQKRSRGQTRRTRTQASERNKDSEREADQSGGASRQHTTTAGQPKSLFDAVKQLQDGGEEGGGDGVKADDIWNKFVTDDQNVVRAPTAQSSTGGTRSSQRTHVTGESQRSQGSQAQSQIEEEEEEEEEEESSDDDRTIYSDYCLPAEYIREEGTPGPRAEIVDSHEACSCFPNRSQKFISSMLYDKITCKHTGLTGHTQPGVFKFNPFWNESMEEPRRLRKRDMRIAKSKFVFGYPKPKFEFVSESEEEEGSEEGSRKQTAGTASKKASTLKTDKTPQTRGTHVTRTDDDDEEEDDSEYESEEYDSEEDEDDEDDEDFVPYQLPQIGYPQTPSLPSSSQSFRSAYSEYSDVPESLPQLPASRQLTGTAQTKRTGITQRTKRTQFTRQETKRSTKTAKSNKTGKSKLTPGKAKSVDSGYGEDSSRRSTASRQSLPAGPVISTSRTFQGKFYDPVKKQVMLYDIGTRPGQRLPAGILEPLYKPPTAEFIGKKQVPGTAKKEDGVAKPGTKGSKRSVTSQESHHSIPKAAVLGGVFISNLLSKNRANREAIEAGYDDEEDNA